MRNVNPYAKFDSGSMQNFRAYSNVGAFQSPATFVRRNSYSPGGAQRKPNSYNFPLNPTLTKQLTEFSYQMQPNFARSHGHTVNAPGYTKHKPFSGPAVHGTKQVFMHAG
ncbi:hypothetical protein BIW11_02944 [Tropilaelaps mercedesae]|uniref:Uncharacterized protein n=1 Tax=Tropilaelaps mercedesae TaxID=418985 RepID=A0A1V9XUM2_9ACAR|nr:hypothetical protein BIW11_02944 [Tropilaelaps mercedesae]